MVNKNKLLSAGISVAIALAVTFGVYVVLIQPQISELSKPAPIEVETQSITRYNQPAVFQDITTFEQPVTMDSTLSVAGATTLTGDVTASGDQSVVNLSASGSITASGNMSMTTLILEGVTSTGPLIAVTGLVSDNILLAHGLSTTPTAVSCTIVNAGILTQSVYISATNATSATFGVFTADGDVVTDNLTVHCFSTR